MRRAPRRFFFDTACYDGSAKLLDSVISHRLSLYEAPEGYELFKNKVEECTTAVLQP